MTSNARIIEMPGLVDLQVNGYRGVDFCSGDLTAEQFADVCRQMLQTGATAFLPTMVTSPRAVYERNLPIMVEVMDRAEFAGRLLGIHLEGPFLSPCDGARGAHNAEWICRSDLKYLDELIEMAAGRVRILTIAAEIEGAEQLTRHATGRGISVFLGHQMACDDDLHRLAAAGARAVTHLGNGVPAMLNRHQNPILAALGADALAATIITDGQHLPPALIKTILRTKGIENTAVISDIAHLGAMPPGQYESLGHTVILGDSGRLYDPRSGYLAGSSATMLQCVNHLASLDVVPARRLAEVAFYNPLRLIDRAPETLAWTGRLLYDTHDRFLYFDK